MHLTIPPSSIRPLTAEVQEALERLRAEADLTEDATHRALLLYEIGAVEEVAEDDHSAARDLLAAVNADTRLHEPLEQLAFLLERRGSFKNLPRLLERMVRVAMTDEEKARGLLALGDFQTDQLSDFEAARKAYEAALELEPPHVDLDLSLQWVALQLGDDELLSRALASRARRAENESYRAALLLLLSRVQIGLGQPSQAQQSLEQAASLETPVKLRALSELERLGRLCEDPRLSCQAVERYALLLEQASRDQNLRRRHSIDASELSAARRADAWLRASQAFELAGERRRAVEFAFKARELLPTDLCLLHWVLERRDALSEEEQSTLLREELNGATDPDTIALLALLSAEKAIAEGNDEQALVAVKRSLEHEPHSTVAHALGLQLLLSRPAPGMALAEYLSQITEHLPEGPYKGRYTVMASAAWAALGAEGHERAKRLLAKGSGISTEVLARANRMLAAIVRDEEWFLDATQRLLKNAAADERPGLLLELARSSWLNRDETATLFNLEEVSTQPAGAWVAAVLLSYGFNGNETPIKERGERAIRALTKLAELSTHSDSKFAARHLVACLRRFSGRHGVATTQLEELHQERPADPKVALELAELLATSDPKRAGEVLSTSAKALDDRHTALMFHLQAAMYCWRAGDRERAIREMKNASALSPEAASALLSWALCSAHPDDPEERRLVLEATRQSGGNLELYALDRFGLEVGLPAHRGDATLALDSVEPNHDTSLGQALALARALWPAAKHHKAALEFLEASGPTGREIAQALAFLAERRADEPDDARLEGLSKVWAKSGSLPGALEWLGATLCQGKVEEEIEARQLIAAQLGGASGASIRASALLLAWLKGQPTSVLAADSALTQLANLETAGPGTDPRRRALSLSRAQTALSGEAVHSALVMAGYNQLLAGQHSEALASFHAALTSAPEDITAWEGIRVVAKKLKNLKLETDALLKLAEHSAVKNRAAELLRERARLLEQGGEEEASWRALEQAVDLDITHFDTFNRLFRWFRAEKRYDKVLELADKRLEVTDDPKEVAKLCWERARAHRALGNMDAALADLDTVRMLDDQHPGPNALSGEIFLATDRPDQAAEQFAALARMDGAPSEQRLMSGMAAADLYENKLDSIDNAILVLEAMQKTGLDTLAIRERLARSYAKTERFEEAVSLLEGLMVERTDHEGRVEAARLSLVLCRDKLGRPERALSACEKLLDDEPTDAEALDFILETNLNSTDALALLERGRDGLLIQPPTAEFDSERLVRLARIAERITDANLRQATLGALVCTPMNNADLRDELTRLEARGAMVPSARIDQATLNALFGPPLTSALGELMRQLAPFIADAIGPSLKSLNLGRRDRLKPHAAPELYDEVARWLSAAGLVDCEIYVGGNAEEVLLLPGPKTGILVLGPALRAPLSQEQRAALGREMCGYLSATLFARGRSPEEATAILLAALDPDASPGEPLVGEFARALSKELPRKTRKLLPELAQRVRQEGLDLQTFVRQVQAGLDRSAALFAGDISYLLLGREQRSQSSRVPEPEFEARLARLSWFVTSRAFFQARALLGLSRR